MFDATKNPIALLVYDRLGSPIPRRFLGLKESAQYLGLSPSSMQKISANRLIPVYKPKGGKVYFLLDDLDQYVLSGRLKSRFEIEAEVAASLNKG
ncbi:MAG TPA: helix-turn-helix domain-containing protein [Flavisolibacter sp.]|jgi:hypothetical protein|nr:helix-turn-helix domain-containing protein [Flavisolibacter sp.]